ncbi:MAG: hypothetical protein AAFU85_33975, partial [Planctomycetota bacterium]
PLRLTLERLVSIGWTVSPRRLSRPKLAWKQRDLGYLRPIWVFLKIGESSGDSRSVLLAETANEFLKGRTSDVREK